MSTSNAATRPPTHELGSQFSETRQWTRLDAMPLLITVPRAGELLGISRSAAYRCAASGQLPTTRLGGRLYVITARLLWLFTEVEP